MGLSTILPQLEFAFKAVDRTFITVLTDVFNAHLRVAVVQAAQPFVHLVIVQLTFSIILVAQFVQLNISLILTVMSVPCAQQIAKAALLRALIVLHA